jgi:hypothetical protein
MTHRSLGGCERVLTTLEFCCATKMPTERHRREP